MNELRATLRPAAGLSGAVRDTASLAGRVAMAAQATVPPYDGAYTVSPDFEGVTLPTQDRVLDKDITVEPIAVARVSNPSGGKTVYIGGNFNG